MEELEIKHPKYLLTDWLDKVVARLSKSEQVEIMSRRNFLINLIQFLIIYIPTILVIGIVVYFIDYMVKGVTTIIIIAILILISSIFISSIYLLCVNCLDSTFGRWIILASIIISSFFCACFMGAIGDVILEKKFSQLSQALYYICYILGFSFNYRVLYEYSWKKFHNSNAFTNLVESVVFILTVVSLFLPINNSFIVPLTISCLVMVCSKLSDRNIFSAITNMQN